jgi:hypothetical protein
MGFCEPAPRKNLQARAEICKKPSGKKGRLAPAQRLR